MPIMSTVYDMMICSPSDTEQEVQAVVECITDFNRNLANKKDPATIVRMLKWNTNVFWSSAKPPQESINEQIVSNCDFAVAVFKRRLGTKCGEDESRTAQEIRLLREQKKQIFVFCLAEDANNDYLNGKSVKEKKEIIEQELALQEYIQKLDNSGLIVNTYTDTNDLRKQLLDQLDMFNFPKHILNLQKVKDYGIIDIDRGSANKDLLNKKIENAKHVKIFHTTGLGFFQKHIHQLAKMLSNNGTLQVLLPNPYSDFLEDVGRIEERGKKHSISEEFNAAIDNLQIILAKAQSLSCDTTGKIEIGCAHTLLRQSEIICIDKENENDDDGKQIWCWITMTMPPYRAGSESISLECQTTKSANSDNLSLAGMTNDSFNKTWEKSKYKFEFNGKQTISYFYMEKFHAQNLWKKKLDAAKKLTAEARNDSKCNGILIEVSAQHPLKPDGTPGIEFTKRLDMGYELYCKNKTNNIRCKLYIPGSLHMDKGITDKVSLSKAGQQYLIEKGVPSDDIYGEDKNVKYRDTYGVYNSADECFVASNIWKDEKFSELFCVCSPIQSMRKTAHYIAFGVFPSIFTCPSPEISHDYVYEMFTALPYVLYEDPYLNPNESKMARKHRVNRNPNFVDI